MKRIFAVMLIILLCQTLTPAKEHFSIKEPVPQIAGVVKNLNIPPSSFLYFVVNGDIDTVKTLLANGADPNFRYMKLPATFFAAHYKQYDILELLLEEGADIDQKYLGITLLDLGVYSNNTEAAHLAITHGANYKKSSEGLEYLSYAIKKNNGELIKILLDDGVIPNKLCLKKAKSLQDEKIKELIFKKGE